MRVKCKTCGKLYNVSKLDKEECKKYCSPECFNSDPENKGEKAAYINYPGEE